MKRIDYLKNKIKYLEKEIESMDSFLSQDRNKSRKDKIATLMRKERRLTMELKVTFAIELMEHESNELKFKKDIV